MTFLYTVDIGNVSLKYCIKIAKFKIVNETFRKIQQFLLARGKNSDALNKKTNFHLFIIILNLRRDSLFPPPGNIS